MQSVAAIITFLEEHAPRNLAEDWDNVGLLLGDRSQKIEQVMTCLTITPESTNEAIEKKAGLIVTHHPILFRGVQRLTTDTAEGRMLLSLIQAGIAVYSPHTALDNTRAGINEMLASHLRLQDIVPLRPAAEPEQCKVVVFVPESDLHKVSQAMFDAGAGIIGEYSHCSFRAMGTGTFLGSEESNPTVGTKGKKEEAPEWRLEVICPRRKLTTVLQAFRAVHSYEEPAYDVYPLVSEQSENQGGGRVGRLAEPAPLQAVAQSVKQSLQCGPIQVIGDPSKPIQSIAIVCGAGGEMLSDAIRARADVFLTGEMRFHDYLRAEAEGIALCLPGHYATERFALEDLANRIQTRFPDLQVHASAQETDPVTWI